ncbi:MAG TPA: glutamate--cysteine ligase [Rubrivivax sp.]|nr:glutamate--cysteine ligase [Burkholderiales bacterium]HNU09838.1 glutamate--cysteine ligase [Rubrivivax sp.]
MVPNLVTALTGPINELEQRVLESMPAIERWFRLEWMEHTPTFYCSVDLRNAGYKLAPVNTDLFPQGFNHLTPQMLPLAVQAAMAAIEKICPEAKNLLLVPCEHCDSASYLEHLQCLVQIFTQAGLNVRLGSADPTLGAPQVLRAPDGAEIVVEPLERHRTRLGLKNFDPCTILLNDDLRAGVPRVLQNLYEQYLLPPLHASWATRRKSRHFRSYEEVAKKFAKLLGMDPWLINPMLAHCGEVDAGSEQGLDCVRGHCESMLAKQRRKFKEYGIAERPFVVVKADAGGMGSGVLTVHDVRELDAARLQRALARPAGEAPAVSEVIIQEGVPTCERIGDAIAEPVVCTIDRYVVGGYYRVHAGRGVDESLDIPGSSYVPLAFAESHHLPARGAKPGASAPNRFYMYGVIARVAMLAAAYELEATDPDAEDYD